MSEDGVGVAGEDNLANEGGERKEGSGEDDWDNAGGDELQRQDGANVTIGRVAVNALGVVDGEDTLGFVELSKEVNDYNNSGDET